MLLAWLRWNRGMFALALWMPVFWVVWSTWGYAQLDPVRSPAEFMHQVVGITGGGAWLALPGFHEEFLLQARQPAVHFGRETPTPAQLSRAFDWIRKAPDQRWMLITQDRMGGLACADLEGARDLGDQNGDRWWLIPGRAFGGCQGSEKDAPLFVAPTTLPRGG
jgi:hypothetical protein